MAKGIVSILTDKIFPVSAPTNQTENNHPKTLLFSQPLNKGDADDAVSHITEKFTARQTAAASQTAAVEKPDDEKTEKTVNDFFKEICERQPFDYDKLVKQRVTLPMKSTKPVEKMTIADYIQAKDRAIYKQAGYGMLTDAEIRAAADMVAAKFPVHNTNFGLNNLHKLDALAGDMILTTNKATIEYAVRAGQAMLQYRDYQAKAIDDAVEKGKDYVNGALGGFVEKPYNAVVNNINGLSEPFRAGEQRIFGTSYLPEIPRSTIGDKSEYWQQKRYGGVSLNMMGEGATTIQVGLMTGRPLYSSRLGALLGVQVGAYNIVVGATGNDPLHPGRQMSDFERSSRIIGGTLGIASAPFSPGGRAFANDALAFPNTARNTVRNLDEIFKPPSNPSLAPAGNVPNEFAFGNRKIFNTDEPTFPNNSGGKTIAEPQKGGNVFEVRAEKVLSSGKVKPTNLPAWEKLNVDTEHNISGHISNGDRFIQSNRAGGNKDLFPEWMNDKQILETIKTAYKNAKKIKTQGTFSGEIIHLVGEANGVKIKMYLDVKTNRLRAHPIK